MNITDALLGEHGIIYSLFDHTEAELENLTTLQEVQQLTRFLAAALVSHARLEENEFFPKLEVYLGPAGPLAMMRHEHHEIDGAIEAVETLDDFDEAVARLRYAIEVARSHFAKEEQILFNMARRSMSTDELESIGQRWAEIRKVAI